MTTAAPRKGRPGVAAQITAADPKVSAWVSANAGSGKTRVLVNRVIRLMLDGNAPERILCLTFTKAAAAEMANRLFERLGEWATLPGEALRESIAELFGRKAARADLAAARRLFARALDTPGGLKIQTIHAFCESLIGRFPLEAGIAPHFSVLDERTAAELLHEARDQVLGEIDGGADPALADALDRVVSLVTEENFAAIMDQLARHRGRFWRMVGRYSGDGESIPIARLIEETRGALGLAPGAGEATVLAEASAAGAFDRDGLLRACAALDAGTAKDRERAAAIRAWVEAPCEARAERLLGDYGAVFLTQAGAPRAESGLTTKAVREADAEAADILLAEQLRLVAVTDRLKAVRVAESTAALLRLAEGLLAAYEARKGHHARLDYDDLILGAGDLLAREGGVSWVLYKLDGGIDHILIDEAQDTSPAQWEVITALSSEFFAGEGARERPGPRTVFAVGDEKQSIFSFQGADPDSFAAMRAYFDDRVRAADQRLAKVEMESSFRSAPSILEAVDLVFARAQARDGVTAASHVLHRSEREGAAGLVEIWPTITPADHPEARPWDAPLDQLAADSPPARLAARIAGRIAGWIGNKEILESRGRPIRPGDVVILVQRRSAFFDEMVRALKERRVPVAGVDRMVLGEQLAVMDLTALGEFLLLPEDDLTLAVVLKGPLFGFTDTDLFDLAHGRGGSLWAALGRRRREREVFAAAHGELAALLARVDYVTPFAFYAGLLGPGRGRERILARLGPDAGDPLDEFLALALDYGRSHAPSMQGFLHWLGAGRTEVRRDLERGRNEVRVMTVHGAKGLEAEVVFLPDTCTVPDPRHDPPLLWTEAAGRSLMLWPVVKGNDESLCAAARAAARLRREQEYRRLLYVAMTRARDRLYVCGWQNRQPKEGETGRPAGCWYDLILDAVRGAAAEVALDFGETGWRLANPQTGPRDEQEEPPIGEAAGTPPPWALAAPGREKTPPRPLAPSRPTVAEPPASSPLAPGPAGAAAGLQRGRLVHRLLEVLPELDPAERAAACRRYLARPVHGLSAAAQEEIAAETLAVLGDADFAPLFGPGSRAEVALAGVVAKTVVSGQVDRLLVGEREVLVVDYKTNRPAPAAPEEVPVAYLKQMAAYRALLAGVYPGRKVRCALLWTGLPRLMALDGEVLARHSP